MANRTLRFGSNGSDVLELQRGLNLLPSAQPKLAQDGIPLSWSMTLPGPIGITTNHWSPTFAQDIKPGDIGTVASKSHHFLIESVGSGPVPRMTTLDGNQRWGRINRIWSTSAEAHQVGVDNFNYYSLS